MTDPVAALAAALHAVAVECPIDAGATDCGYSHDHAAAAVLAALDGEIVQKGTLEGHRICEENMEAEITRLRHALSIVLGFSVTGPDGMDDFAALRKIEGVARAALAPEASDEAPLIPSLRWLRLGTAIWPRRRLMPSPPSNSWKMRDALAALPPDWCGHEAGERFDAKQFATVVVQRNQALDLVSDLKADLARLRKIEEAARGLAEVESHRFTGFYSSSRSPDENGNRSQHGRFMHAYFDALDALRAALAPEASDEA